jgi:hypothetical protein
MPPDTSTHEPTLKEITGKMIRQLASGVSQEKLIVQLKARGWPEVSARQFVANLAQTALQHDDVDDERDAHIEQLRRRILRDFILVLITSTMMFLSITFFATFSLIGLFFLGMSLYAFIDMILAYILYIRIRK